MKSFLMLFVAPSLVHAGGSTTINVTPEELAKTLASTAKTAWDLLEALAPAGCTALAAATPACATAATSCEQCVNQAPATLGFMTLPANGGGQAPAICKWTQNVGCELNTFGTKLVAKTTATTPYQDWTAICTAQGVEVAIDGYDIMGAKATAVVTAETQCNQTYGYAKRQPYDATHQDVAAGTEYRQPCAWSGTACEPNTAFVSPFDAAFYQTTPTSAAVSTYTFGAVTFVSVAAFLFS